MKEHFVSYSQAVNLKELGFDGNGLKNCIRQGYYKFPNGYISPIKHDGDGILVQFRKEDAERVPAPRLDQAAAWLREVKGWDITSIPTLAEYGEKKYRWDICHWSKPEYGNCSNGIFDSYELALSAGIDATLELLTDKLYGK